MSNADLKLIGYMYIQYIINNWWKKKDMIIAIYIQINTMANNWLLAAIYINIHICYLAVTLLALYLGLGNGDIYYHKCRHFYKAKTKLIIDVLFAILTNLHICHLVTIWKWIWFHYDDKLYQNIDFMNLLGSAYIHIR